MKAILVMDEMPEECGRCFLWEGNERSEWCVGARHRRIHDDVPLDGKPDWCPLRPLPKRKEEMDYLATGYNKCLDDILEED